MRAPTERREAYAAKPRLRSQVEPTDRLCECVRGPVGGSAVTHM